MKGLIKMIKEYIDNKDNKKYYEIKNHYIGKDVFTGKEKRISKKGFRTKKDAENYCINIKHDFLNGYVFDTTHTTFEDLYNLFNEQYKYQVKESTYYTHKTTFKNILVKFGKLKIKNITLPLCQKYLNDVSEDYTRDYVKNIKAKIGMVLDYAVKMGLLNTNYMKLAKVPKKKDEKKKNYYTKNELLEFLNIVKDNFTLDVYVAFRLLAFTGARKGELASLTWKDFNFKENTLTINKNMINVEGKTIISDTKTTASNRVIFIDKETVDILLKYRKQQGFIPLDTSIFPINMYWINNSLRAIYKTYPNLRQISIHGFRHTHATLLYESGVNVKDISERLGHSDVNITLNIYTHLTEVKKKDTSDLFAKYMSV